MKRFVIGDIHGAFKALIQCLERSDFNHEKDMLICMGDLSDGWPDTSKVLDELLKISNLVMITGNHDIWLARWFEFDESPKIWLSQGGNATIGSYKDVIPLTHKHLLRALKPYFILDNLLFVHGGFDTKQPIENQKIDVLAWDRSLIRTALIKRQIEGDCKLTDYNMVFTGHTPTFHFGESTPIFACDICMMDTGAGWPGGRLTILNIDTLEYFSSDVVQHLYPDFRGRE